MEYTLKIRSISLAAIALTGLTFLSACGGGGGGVVSDAGSASAEAVAATPAAAAGLTIASTVDASAPAAVSTVPGIAYPFGSHLKAYVAGILPKSSDQASQDAVIRKQYKSWKAKGVKNACGGSVVTFSDDFATVSEGAGYGMLLTVLMAGSDDQAKTVFDGLLRVVRSHPAYNTGYPALMDWRVNADCSAGGGGGWNAMDGDLDIAMALLMADKQWGSSGAVNYKAEALATIAALKAFNMSPEGFTRGLPNQNNNRTSDYMITHFKAFARATGDAFWTTASDKAFYLLNLMQTQYAPSTGLIPDFVVNTTGSNPTPSPGYVADNNPNEGFYYWNACRLPWRLASDYVTSGDTRSKVITGKMMDFFNSNTAGNPTQLSAGYKLDGTKLSYNPDWIAPAFLAPITAGALVDTRFQPFLNNLWTYTASHPTTGYYGTELQLLSLIVTTGNWWNP